jgi:microsomal dipeptidase-like Zn-dependent dipeptidase
MDTLSVSMAQQATPAHPRQSKASGPHPSTSPAPSLPPLTRRRAGFSRPLVSALAILSSACSSDVPVETRELGGDSEALIATPVGRDLGREELPIDGLPDFSRFLPRRWDFEDGTLQGFVHEEVPAAEYAAGAFYNQPTFGDNVSAARALDTDDMTLPADPCAGLVLDERTTCEYGAGNVHMYLRTLQRDLTAVRAGLSGVGGDFWHAPFPIGKQGLYWIGSAENRPSRRIDPRSVPASRAPRAQDWGTTQGDTKVGRLISPEFEVQHDYFHLLVGGGCSSDVGVYLQTEQTVITRDAVITTPGKGNLPGTLILDGARVPSSGSPTRKAWLTARDKSSRLIAARGNCVENMVRVSFDISNLKGTKKARIVIEDRATGPWGHINVDDINLTSTPPKPSSRASDPIWGVADLHAHLMNEKSFTAYQADGRVDANLLWGNALGPLESMGKCNDTHTASFDEPFGSHYTLCRDLCINLLEGAALKPHGGGAFDGMHHDTNGGYPNFTAWPLFYSAAHQQMHHTWVRRAFDGGLRTMIATVGNSEVLAFSLTKERGRPFTSDQDALALQIPAIKEFARQNSSWVEVVYTPRDARRVANAGKLALIIGVELDHVMDSCAADVTRIQHHTARENSHPYPWASAKGYDLDEVSGLAGAGNFIGGETRVVNVDRHPRTCSPAQIEARLAALYEQGVRHVIPMHFSDNMLGGYALSSEMFVASAVFGSPDASPPVLGTADEARGINFKLGSIQTPIWARLRPDFVVDGNFLEPGIGRTVLDFFTGGCIDDEAARIVAAFFSLGATEAACGMHSLSEHAFNEARAVMPYEGLTDSPLMLSFKVPQNLRDLPGHVNGRGLSDDGVRFIQAMMRRGMLVDLQHASEKAKNRMLDVLGAYPAMASHGGVQDGATRSNEGVLSREQLGRVYAPPGGFAGGLVGVGAQSSRAVMRQLSMLATEGAGPSIIDHETMTQTRGVAIGSDMNGVDWHVAPRFGRWAFPQESPAQRRARVLSASPEGVGVKVRYEPYPAATNPYASTQPDCAGCTWPSGASSRTPLRPHQVVQGSQITRTFDINFDGLAHYGLIPDFLQEVAEGTSGERMGMVFRSAESLVKMWEEACYQAYQLPSPPSHLVRGCGPRSDYE